MDKELWLAVMSGILTGTFFTGLFRYLSTRRFQSISLEEKLRAEMVQQVDRLKNEMDTLKKELDAWREKYANLEREYNRLKSEFAKLKKDNHG